MSFFKQFKLKDIFTALNLFLSFYAVILAFQGNIILASYLLIFSIFVLDILDGIVARVTKTGNEFGKHFDSITDFLGSSVAVSFLIYVALKDVHVILGVVAGFSFLFTGVLREIKQRLEPISGQGYFIGFPRNSACVVVIAFFNTSLFQISPLLILPYLVLLIYFQLSRVPFMGSDKKVLLQIPRVRNYLIAGVFYILIHAAVGLFWNSMLTIMCCFLLSPYLLVRPEIWQYIEQQTLQLEQKV